jgi:hypothetical protein
VLRLASPCFALLRLASPCFALLRLASPCFALLRLASPVRGAKHQPFGLLSTAKQPGAYFSPLPTFPFGEREGRKNPLGKNKLHSYCAKHLRSRPCFLKKQPACAKQPLWGKKGINCCSPCFAILRGLFNVLSFSKRKGVALYSLYSIRERVALQRNGTESRIQTEVASFLSKGKGTLSTCREKGRNQRCKRRLEGRYSLPF